jgi:hypothetical protein
VEDFQCGMRSGKEEGLAVVGRYQPGRGGGRGREPSAEKMKASFVPREPLFNPKSHFRGRLFVAKDHFQLREVVFFGEAHCIFSFDKIVGFGGIDDPGVGAVVLRGFKVAKEYFHRMAVMLKA